MLRQRLGIEDVATGMQWNRLRWSGHDLRTVDEDWAKNVPLLRLRGQSSKRQT